MADLEKIRARIREIAQRRKNVVLGDFEWVVAQLANCGYPTHVRPNVHGRVYSINGRRFSVCTHKTGSKQLKSCYVDEFLRVMVELELYEED